MAGIPPLLGFFSKQFLLYSAIQIGYYFIAIVAIVVSIISASYYIKIIRVLHTEPINEENLMAENIEENRLNKNIETKNNNKGLGFSIISNYHSYLISTLTLSILLFILKPSILLNSTQLLSLSLFNY